MKWRRAQGYGKPVKKDENSKKLTNWSKENVWSKGKLIALETSRDRWKLFQRKN